MGSVLLEVERRKCSGVTENATLPRKLGGEFFELHGNLIWATKVEKDSTPLLPTQDMKINAQRLIN
jgi:hypothetical protein